MKRIIVIFITLVTFIPVNAAIVDTIQVYSKTMQKNILVVVIRPDNYNSLKVLPVVYMLHGY
ncbi:MAG TPA: esterase family protein, partial [Bacteroidales bacterium]|nr:esterase family protein [Bacteroidales bacterium]